MDNFSDKFFGGINQVKSKLVAALKDKRIKLGLSTKEVGRGCCIDIPNNLTYAEIEQDPRLLTSKTFSLASMGLNVPVNEVIPIKFSSPSEMQYAIQTMRLEGNNPPPGMGYAEAAEMYTTLRILKELDI